MLQEVFDVPAWTLVILVCVAFGAGWVDAVVGGGGLIQLPALLIGLPADTSASTISGTNKVSSMAGTTSATLTYLRRIRVDWRDVAPLLGGAALGAAVGARMVTYLPREWFTPAVLVALVVVGLTVWRRPAMGLQADARFSGWSLAWRAAVIGVAVGGYDGFLGPGTGTFFVVALVRWLGHDFLAATARAKLANLATNVAAVATLAGHINWPLGLVMASTLR